MLSANAYGKLGTQDAIEAFLSSCDMWNPDWDIVWVSESDFFAKHEVDSELNLLCEPHRTFRFWPGTGSRAVRFFVNS